MSGYNPPTLVDVGGKVEQKDIPAPTIMERAGRYATHVYTTLSAKIKNNTKTSWGPRGY